MRDEMDGLLKAIPLPLRDQRILYWDELTKSLPCSPVIVYGAGNEGVNAAAHMQRIGMNLLCFIDKNPPVENFLGLPVLVPTEAALRFDRDAIVIAAVGAYVYDEAVYRAIQQTITSVGFQPPYYIHEFSYGYSLGAERIFQDKDAIQESFYLLADEASQRVFVNMIKNAMTPFGRNLSFTPENLGVPLGKEKHAEQTFTPADPVKTVLYCSTNDFDAFDPDLLRYDDTLYCYPIQLYRYKLKELLYKEKGISGSFTVLDYVLSDYVGETSIEKKLYMGGTPLTPTTEILKSPCVTADSLVKDYALSLGMIKLDMRDCYVAAIDGAEEVIASQHPVIAINGFARVNYLWEIITDIASRLPEYNLYLRRYAHINQMMGHTVYAVHKGDCPLD